MTMLELNGVRVFYEQHGSGPALVLVHGLGGTGRSIWLKLVPELIKDGRVVTYDHRGSGQSEVMLGKYTIDLLTEDLNALIEALGLETVSLMGHSMGGSIVLNYAAEHPDRVRAVVAIGAPTALSEAEREALTARADTVLMQGMAAVAETVANAGLSSSFREANPDEFQAIVTLLEANDPTGYAGQCRAIAAMDLTGKLRSIAAPTLLIAGDLDAVSPPATNEATAEAIPNASFVTVEGRGAHLSLGKSGGHSRSGRSVPTQHRGLKSSFHRQTWVAAQPVDGVFERRSLGLCKSRPNRAICLDCGSLRLKA